MKTIVEYLINNHIKKDETGNVESITRFKVDSLDANIPRYKKTLSREDIMDTLKIQLGIDTNKFGDKYFEAFIDIEDMVRHQVSLSAKSAVILVEYVFADILKEAKIDTITLYRPTPGEKASTHISFAYYDIRKGDTTGTWEYCYYNDLKEPLKEMCKPLYDDIKAQEEERAKK